MGSSALLLGILPLLFFVIVDSFFGIKAALVTASLLALGEAAYSWFIIGELDYVTGASVFLVLLLAGVSWKTKSEKFFLFQPVILSGLFGLYLLVSHWSGHYLFYEMINKYNHLFPAQLRPTFTHPMMIAMMKKMSLTAGVALLAHGAVIAYAAVKLSKWWWLFVRGVGFYFFIFAASYAARILVAGQ